MLCDLLPAHDEDAFAQSEECDCLTHLYIVSSACLGSDHEESLALCF